MAKQTVELLSFNRGLISRLGLARNDIERVRNALSSTIQNNWMPRVLGSMMLRPGWGYKSATAGNNKNYDIEFVYSNDDTAIVELTNTNMRVLIDDVVISRVSVSTAVTSGDFSSATGWTDADESGTTSTISGGVLSLVGTIYNTAIRRQEVTVSGGDQNKEHALSVVVTRGSVLFKVGSSSGAQDYVREQELGPGTYSIAFTPTGNFWIEFAARTQSASIVDSCTVESSGDMDISAPWSESDLGLVRYAQSGNVIYANADGYKQYKIIRVDTGVLASTKRSWGVSEYLANDGPFRLINTTSTRITPSGLTGDITLTASRALFASTNVGSLFRITSVGQNVSITISGEAQWSDPIRVTGVGAQRRFFITRASLGGTSTTATLQRSVGEVGSWNDVTTYTTNGGPDNYDDGLDNQIIYYRIGVDTGDYSSGAPVLSMSYAAGGLTGICRITAYSSPTSVSAAVLKPLGATTASEDWEEGAWSDRRGHPSCVTLYEGRRFVAGRSQLWGSASDAYESYDDEIEGNSRPITRSIGRGPVDTINWLIPSQRLVMGGQGSEWVVRSSTFDEIMTHDNANLKDPSNQGSAPVQALKVDKAVLFVQKSLKRLFQTQYSVQAGDDYDTDDLSKLAPEIFQSGIVRLGLQRQPDTRVHCVLGNGRVAILILDSLEEIKCWVTASTLGFIEDVVVLPGDDEDAVYYTVRRTIDGNTVRYRERWAAENECSGGTYVYEGASTDTISIVIKDNVLYPDGMVLTARDADGDKIENVTVANGAVTLSSAVTYAALTPSVYKLADSHIMYSGSSTSTITGLSHLEGEEVIAFGDGKDLGTYTVSSGSITLSEAVETCCVGLYYEARFKSVKLANVDRSGEVLNQSKSIDHIGLIMLDTHMDGVYYGPDFDNLDPLPAIGVQREAIDSDFIHYEFDDNFIEFDGEWTTDARVCLEARAPKPANVLSCAVVMNIEQERSNAP